MKKWNRMLALILAFLMVFSLAACWGGDKEPDTTEEPSAPVTPSEQPEPSPEPQDEDEKTPVDPADLVGAWDLYAWELLTGGSYTEVVDQQFVFTEDVLDYVISGTVTTHNNYSFTDEYTIHLTDINNPDAFVDWGIYMKDDVLTIEDPLTGVYYYCRKAEEAD